MDILDVENHPHFHLFKTCVSCGKDWGDHFLMKHWADPTDVWTEHGNLAPEHWHLSDCAMNNIPALPAGDCTCQKPIALLPCPESETREVQYARAGSLEITVGQRYRWRGCTGTFIYGGRSGVGEITKIIVLSPERPKLGRPMFRPGDTLIRMIPDDGPEACFQPYELEFAPLDSEEYQLYQGRGFDKPSAT